MRYNVSKCLLTINNKRNQFNPGNHLYGRYGRRYFHSCHDNRHSWSVLKYLYNKQLKDSNKKYACLLLNLDAGSSQDSDRYQYIWNNANLKVAVDGSANILSKRNQIHTADIICGDFDSIDTKLLHHLRSPAGVEQSKSLRDRNTHKAHRPLVIETPNQNQTDFTKAIRVSMVRRPDINFFFAIFNFDGLRIDHLFASINTIHLIRKHIVLVNVKSNTISWLLPSGAHEIHKPRGRELCSLVPFAGSTEVKTKGLEYNLSPSMPLCFGSLVSTSNVCRDDHEIIHVETNRDLFWSIDICK